MNFSPATNCIIATVLIIIYLVLPATNIAHAVAQEVGVPSAQPDYNLSTAAPCGNCPCSDEQDSNCCDTFFCSCECHAPLCQRKQLTYTPVIGTQIFQDPAWSLPQVYHSIFVPPQNIS